MRRKYRVCKDGIYRVIGYKKISISVRIYQEIYDIVMEYEGKTFTEKLINLIFDYKEFHDLKKS